MKGLVFLFLVIYGIERILETFWKREKIQGAIKASYTLPLLIGLHVLIYMVSFWELLSLENYQILWGITFGGMIMVLVSIAGRNWAIKALGLYHSIHIEIRANHELIRSGPYKLVRNPYYLSNVIESVGLPLAANANLGLLLSLFCYIPLVIFRMVLEERALESKFKDLFFAYKRQVPRILPKLH
jgi:protein-S-isoprenylcysteine O-methyltransferase Ste14